MDSLSYALFTLILFFLLPFTTSDFTPTTSYFLACGSSSGVTITSDHPSRNFTSDSGYLTSKNSVPVTDRSSSSSSLYATARVFLEPANYRFTVNSQGTHVLRLHFFPFSARDYNLSAARFNVSALGRFLLLADFSAPMNSSSAMIKEFFLWVDSGKLDVAFLPSTSSSFAFVNAIEVFNTPKNLIRDKNEVGIDQLTHQALEKVYRINVAGPEVTPANDTLWRTWIPDDEFFLNPSFSLENNTSQNNIKYPSNGSVTPEVAPASVYDTARIMNVSSDMRTSNPTFDFNLTWSFRVSSGYRYFVRLHFCDFISPSFGDSIYFNVFIGDDLVKSDLQSRAFTSNLAEPFYLDLGADVPKSELINVSVGRSQKFNALEANAMLNGLEIFKANNSFGSLSGDFNPSFSATDKKKNGVSIATVVPAVVGGFILSSLVSVILVLLFLRKRHRAKPEELTTLSWSPYQGTPNSGAGLSGKSTGGTTAPPSVSPRVLNLGLLIPFVEIKAATNHFDEQLIVGSGGFGKVYKGILSDGTKVAVKRGSLDSKQGYPEFQTEIMLLSQIRHKHLVSLIGYCEEMSERILVYEYMEKGTLRDHLYGSPDKPCLSWKQRLEICIGAARGLHYLHTGYSHTIIHRDVKSTNILLGEDYLAKVSDFGLSKLGPSYGETHVTTGVKGTIGYLDPEYFKTQKLTDKSDVYSFGVMLLEVLCARPVIEQGLSRDQLNLAEWALQWQRKGQLEKIIDVRLVGKINQNSLRKFGETAGKCLEDYGIDRPTVADVLWNLEYALQLQETEVKREPHDDSGNVDSQIPAVEAARVPSGGHEDGSASTMSAGERMTESSVFSQLIGDGEGR